MFIIKHYSTKVTRIYSQELRQKKNVKICSGSGFRNAFPMFYFIVLPVLNCLHALLYTVVVSYNDYSH